VAYLWLVRWGVSISYGGGCVSSPSHKLFRWLGEGVYSHGTGPGSNPSGPV
jgi:hypothetical protein